MGVLGSCLAAAGVNWEVRTQEETNQEALETVVERPGGTDGARESEGWFESGLSNEGSFSACVATRRDLHVPLWSQCAHGGNTGLYAWAEGCQSGEMVLVSWKR